MYGEIGALSVSITGERFATDPLKNIVYFGGQRVEVVGGASSSVVEVNVPNGISSVSEITVINMETKLMGSSQVAPNPLFHVTFPNGDLIPEYTYPTYELSVGDEPHDVTIADINKDGYSDIIVANDYDNSLSFYYRKLDGNGFEAEEKLSLLSKPTSIVAKDINNDGLVDLVVSHFTNPGVISTILRMPDNSGFAPYEWFNVPENPVDLVVTDINLDGLLDIAVVCQDASGSVTIYHRKAKNTGYESSELYSTGSNASSMVSGDFNQDGLLDLAVCMENSSANLQLLLRSSDNSAMDVTFPQDAGVYPSKIRVGDFDADGNTDLACITGDEITIMENAGSAIFVDKGSYFVGDTPFDLAIGDFNGDSKTDIATTNLGGNSISIIQGNGGWSFEAPIDFSVGDTPSAIATGDINNDGRADLVVANSYDDNLSLLMYKEAPIEVQDLDPFINDTNIGADQKITIEFDAAIDPSSLINGETFSINGSISGFYSNVNVGVTGAVIELDPITANTAHFANGETVTVSITQKIKSLKGANMISNRSWQFTVKSEMANAEFKTLPPVSLSYAPQSFSIGDYNRDSTLDATVLSAVIGKSYMLKNSDSTFSEVASNSASTNANKIISGDFNKDGKIDYAVLSSSPEEILIKLNLNGESFSDFATLPLMSGSNPIDILTTDLNGDGQLDLVALYASMDGFAVFEGKGDGNFETPIEYSTLASNPVTIAAADFDKNGYIDLIMGHGNDEGAYIFYNEPEYPFSNYTQVVEGYSIRKIVAGVLNSDDNDVDIAWLDDTTGEVKVQLFDGEGFGGSTVLTIGSNPQDLVLGDFDGDGLSDLLSANYDDKSLSLRLNLDAGSFETTSEVALDGAPVGIAVGDFNFDHKVDIVVLLKSPQELVILENDFKTHIDVKKGELVGDVLQQSSTKNPIYRVDMHFTEKDIWLDELTVKTSGNYTTVDIATGGFQLWFNNTNNLSSATALSTPVSSSSGAGEWLYYGGISQPIYANDSVYLWITADISASAVIGNEIGIVGLAFENMSFQDVMYNGTNPIGDGNIYSIIGPILPEPTGHVTSLAISYEGSDSLTLEWLDATGSQWPEGYSVLARKLPTDFISLVDGTESPEESDWSDDQILVLATHQGTSNQVGFGGLPVGKYEFAVVPYTNSGSYIDYKTDAFPTVTAEFFAEPSVPADSIQFNKQLVHKLELSWKNGDGDRRIVVASEVPTILPPTDMSWYLADTIFGNGDQTGNGNYVVYNGNGNSVLVHGLNPETLYYFQVFEMNGDNLSNNYSDASTALNPNSKITLAPNPIDAVTSLAFGEIQPTSVRLSYKMPVVAPEGFLVLRRGALAPSSPRSGTVYSVNELIGDQVVVYVGSDTTFVDTGLIPASTYGYDVYVYNGSGESINYFQSAPHYGEITLPTSEPTVQTSGLKVVSVDTNEVKLSWVNGNGNGRILLAKESGGLSFAPQDMLKYTADNTYGLGDGIGGGYVVYVGTGEEATITGLVPNTSYEFAIGEYNEQGIAINYLTQLDTANKTWVTTLQSEPLVQASNLIFESIGEGSVSASFTPSGAEGYLVIRRTGTATAPIDGVTYSDGDIYAGQFTVSSYASSSFFDTLLLPETPYTYDVYAFNGFGSTINYLQLNPLMGTATTLAQSPASAPSDLVFTEITSSSIKGSFKPAATPVDGYLVLSTAVINPVVDVENGVVYVVGDVIGDAVVIGVGTDTTFERTGLVVDTEYRFGVFAYSGSGTTINYLADSVLLDSAFTQNNAPENLTFTSNTIFEGMPIGSGVGKFSASDIDPGDTLSFSLVSGIGATDNSSFYMDGDSLRLSNVLYHHLQNTYRIRVAASDEQGESVEKFFTIDLQKLPLSSEDSLNLVAVYDSAATKIPWDTSEPISTWSGVSVQFGRVDRLSLKSYGLSDLHTDAISELDSLKTLDVSNNKLSFKYLEPLSGMFDTMSYIPQYTGLAVDTIVVLTNSEVKLEVERETPNEIFEWKRQGEVIAGADSEVLDLGVVEKIDRGFYRALVTNSKLPGLTVYRNPIYLQVISSLTSEDSLALLEVYQALEVTFDPSTPAGSWPGVVEEGGKVVEINLSNRLLGGVISQAIGQLTGLTKIDLFNNNLQGEIPVELSFLQELTYLDLDDNDLEGGFPDGIELLTKLKTLWLSRNKLTSISDQIGSLSNLENLFLQENQIDSLPDELGTLSQLKVLNVSDNKLTYIPSSLSGLISLEKINLANNELEDVSADILQLTNLLYIDLSNNNLVDLPGDFNTLPNLQELKVHGNLLDFGDLEPLDYSGSVYELSYIPQRWSFDTYDTLVMVGSNVDLTSGLDGTSNVFEWQRDYASIAGETNEAVSLINISGSDIGVYRCKVSNSLVPNLVLYNQPVRILLDCGGEKKVEVTTQYDTELCEGENIFVELVAESVPGRVYRWKQNGRTLALADTSSYIAFEQGIYSLVISDEDGCSAVSNEVVITTKPTPEVSISESDSTTLDTYIAGNTQNGLIKWYFNGQEVVGANSSSITVEESGVYQAAFENEFGCEGVSEEHIMVITALEDEAISLEMSVYPNPTKGKFFIDLGKLYKSVQVKAVDMTGKSWALKNFQHKSQIEMDLADMPSGLYLITIQTERGTSVKRIQKL
ncbi:FG-GAP-like repeat-containing protein [Flammeovirgaceae bacterium SG7u.132]|nr:FG-GAP-like repeat-containing protein [Flammeovirgaceae bacterium SG7u.132]